MNVRDNKIFKFLHLLTLKEVKRQIQNLVNSSRAFISIFFIF